MPNKRALLFHIKKRFLKPIKNQSESVFFFLLLKNQILYMAAIRLHFEKQI